MDFVDCLSNLSVATLNLNGISRDYGQRTGLRSLLQDYLQMNCKSNTKLGSTSLPERVWGDCRISLACPAR